MSGSNGKNGHADFTFSLVRGIADDKPADTTFRRFMTEVRDGRWRREVEELRAVLHEATQQATTAGLAGKEFKDAVKNATRPIKTRLPGACFSGTFSYRDAEHLQVPSGLICADLDDLNERVESVRDIIAADPHTLGCAISPSGTGLKVVFRIDPARPHLESFRAAKYFVRETFGLDIDAACKDINRLCFVTYDPDAFIADDALVLPYPPADEIVAPPAVTLRARVDFPVGFISPGDDFNARGDWKTLVRGAGWKEEHEPYWCRPGKDHGISASWDIYPDHFHVFTDAAPPLQPGNYRPFALFAFLQCGGDFQRASDELSALGYGTPKKPKPAPMPTPDPDSQELIDAEQEASMAGQNGGSHMPETPEEQITRLTKAYNQRQAKDSPIGDTSSKPTTPEDKKSEFIKAFRAKLELRRFNLANPPRDPVPRFFIKGNATATPGNISNLLSQTKTGKSAFGGAHISAAIVGSINSNPQFDTLGVTAPSPGTLILIHLDTEQSPADHDKLVRRCLRRGGVDEPPVWLWSYGCAGYSAAELRLVLRILLDEAKAAGGVFAVLIDGIADFVNDINDPKETNPFVAELMSLAIEFFCPIINVIHENPGQDGGKMRGHLGSQLERKAESNIRLKKSDEITVVYSERMRNAPILEKDGPRFKWSTDDNMHVSCGSCESARDVAKRDKVKEIWDAVVTHSGKRSFKYGDLTKLISEVAHVGASRAEDRLLEMRKYGVIEKDIVGLWRATG